MQQQNNDESQTASVPIIPLCFFPYPVTVVSKTISRGDRMEAPGLLFETSEVVIGYPFKDSSGKILMDRSELKLLDVQAIVLPNGEAMESDDWAIIDSPPSFDRRLMASFSMLAEAQFAYGEGEGESLFEQAVQAQANTQRLSGLPYAYLLSQIGAERPRINWRDGSGEQMQVIPNDRRFLAVWTGVFRDPGSRTVGGGFFTLTAGYDREELASIDALAVGQTWQSDTYGLHHTVTRIADAD
ncbi:hypothetical protein BLA39750_01147 [Burkholderia lata]|uniref:Uncharacterized protein n=1 Tax=Burkholderia lata (strain ATCC 17760 / DSM 23089 / LMG 22485 / NCIMB 9086 / R18194 / 383) TaxID=482957 RepID=A0A6P2VFB8_BURL3|nr:hypothetical protein [Burkholderia lata]VWC80303.1 hypothetical protein BLA39750_01147 [Burkholderia lata]